ncbi:ATP-binding protein [bacterium]
MICNHKHDVKRHRSIFLRLLFVLLATMGLVHLVIGGAFGLLFRTGSMSYIESNIQHYAESLTQEIGTPPDTVKARKLAHDYRIYIRYESDDFRWVSHEKMPRRLHRKGHGPSSMWRKPIIVHNEDGSQYTLVWRFGPFMGMDRQIFVGLLLIVTMIFLGAHGYIRHILRPIQWLRKGVDEISQGNLDVKIPKDRHDELGRLTEAFNDMVQRIKQMIVSRDQLLLDVSHELRSPLTRIKVALEFIKESEKKTAILSDIAEIETMITEILETERLDTEHGRLNRTDADLIALVNAVVREFQDKPPGIKMSDHPVTLLISIDINRIRMLLKNVFENASKFSREDSKQIEVSIEVTDKQAALQIRDYGIGIPEDQLPYLFEPFFRVDRSRSKITGGYGLGLHLCKKIMEVHGGEISIRNSKSGDGVTVELIFRLSQENC